MKFVEPRPRPRVVSGKTIVTSTGCGKLYVTINEDEHGIFEVFLRLGKSGGCSASQTEAIGKLISLALRCNVNPEEIVRKLKGIRCPQLMWQDGEAITSCADAIAKVLEKYLKGEYDKLKRGAEKSVPLDAFAVSDSSPSKTASVQDGGAAPATSVSATSTTPASAATSTPCPECGSPMYPSEGCHVCRNCGYTKCG